MTGSAFFLPKDMQERKILNPDDVPQNVDTGSAETLAAGNMLKRKVGRPWL